MSRIASRRNLAPLAGATRRTIMCLLCQTAMRPRRPRCRRRRTPFATPWRGDNRRSRTGSTPLLGVNDIGWLLANAIGGSDAEVARLIEARDAAQAEADRLRAAYETARREVDTLARQQTADT